MFIILYSIISLKCSLVNGTTVRTDRTTSTSLIKQSLWHGSVEMSMREEIMDFHLCEVYLFTMMSGFMNSKSTATARWSLGKTLEGRAVN